MTWNLHHYKTEKRIGCWVTANDVFGLKPLKSLNPDISKISNSLILNPFESDLESMDDQSPFSVSAPSHVSHPFYHLGNQNAPCFLSTFLNTQKKI